MVDLLGHNVEQGYEYLRDIVIRVLLGKQVSMPEIKNLISLNVYYLGSSRHEVGRGNLKTSIKLFKAHNPADFKLKVRLHTGA